MVRAAHWHYEHGRGRGVDKGKRALELFTQAAEAGDSYAQYKLGKMYLDGDIADENEEEAARWFEKSATQGFRKAQRRLAHMHLQGKLGKKDDEIDYEAAFRWTYEAAQAGDIWAQGLLGTMYSEGKGVEQDLIKAIHWFRRSAENGVDVSMYNLGHMYYFGKGLEQDKDTAMGWIGEAADRGNEKAREFLDKLNESENDEARSDEAPKGPEFLSRALAAQLTGEHIVIPESYTVMEAGAFSERQDIQHITLPSSMAVVADKAFYYSSLVSINLPEGVQEIGKEAFGDCDGLTSITLPNSLTVVDSGAFRDCSSLTEIKVSAEHPCFTVHEDALFDKEMQRLICCPAGLQRDTYTLPASVHTIGEAAFASCSALEEIVLHENVTSIEYDAFFKCSRLARISLPDSLSFLGDYVFYQCHSLKTIKFPKGLHAIPNGTFSECMHLRDVQIPESITAIGEEAFRFCEGIKMLKIPSSVTRIGRAAFMHCVFLKEIFIPESVTFIGRAAFYTDGLLTVVTPKDSFTDHYLDLCDGEYTWRPKLNVDGGLKLRLTSINPAQ